MVCVFLKVCKSFMLIVTVLCRVHSRTIYSKIILWDFFVLGNIILETDGLHFQDINKAHIYNLTVILPRIQEHRLLYTQYLPYPQHWLKCGNCKFAKNSFPLCCQEQQTPVWQLNSCLFFKMSH